MHRPLVLPLGARAAAFFARSLSPSRCPVFRFLQSSSSSTSRASGLQRTLSAQSADAGAHRERAGESLFVELGAAREQDEAAESESDALEDESDAPVTATAPPPSAESASGGKPSTASSTSARKSAASATDAEDDAYIRGAARRESAEGWAGAVPPGGLIRPELIPASAMYGAGAERWSPHSGSSAREPLGELAARLLGNTVRFRERGIRGESVSTQACRLRLAELFACVCASASFVARALVRSARVKAFSYAVRRTRRGASVSRGSLAGW